MLEAQPSGSLQQIIVTVRVVAGDCGRGWFSLDSDKN